MRKLPVILAVGFMFGCASEGSLTAPTQALSGTTPLKVENVTSGEFVIVNDALPADPSSAQIGASGSAVAVELGWLDAAGAAKLKTLGRPTPINDDGTPGCGGYNCFKYEDPSTGKTVDCGGNGLGCGCIRICG